MFISIWIEDPKILSEAREQYIANTGMEEQGWLIDGEGKLEYDDMCDSHEPLFQLTTKKPNLEIFLIINLQDLLAIIEAFQFKPIRIQDLIKQLKEA